jgi:hypothetical protein
MIQNLAGISLLNHKQTRLQAGEKPQLWIGIFGPRLASTNGLLKGALKNNGF